MLSRLEYLVSKDDLDKIINSHILIVGIGGVGGACLEGLVRLGIKYITVIDNDSFDISNLNRQILCTRNNLGHSKALEAVLRAKSINDGILIDSKEMFLNETNIDCCDTMTTKILLIKKAIDNNIKIISSMGTGNRLDPTKLVITDIWKTNNDPVAKVMRSLLRKNGINNKIPVVCSLELPIKIHQRRPGSTSLVPNVAGFYMASYVFNDIISNGK